MRATAVAYPEARGGAEMVEVSAFEKGA